jgi:hypothetical protein
MLHILGALEQAYELRSHKTGVVIVTRIICISRSQTLQVNYIGPLISTSDSFYFNTASDFDD